MGKDVTQVIAADLERSGLFKPIDPRAFIQSPASLRVMPNFPDWRVINANALVTGTAQMQGDGQLRVEFRLWDVFAGQQLVGLAYSTAPMYWRRLAHKIADAIYKAKPASAKGTYIERAFVSATFSPGLRLDLAELASRKN